MTKHLKHDSFAQKTANHAAEEPSEPYGSSGVAHKTGMPPHTLTDVDSKDNLFNPNSTPQIDGTNLFGFKTKDSPIQPYSDAKS